MSFLSSIFLWTLPLVGIPIAIHLLNRRRRQTVPWGAMQFLMESLTRRKRFFRVEDLILMALRAAAFLLIILALARPQLKSEWLSGSNGHREVFLIIDTSLSTGRVEDGKPVLSRIMTDVRSTLARLQPSDVVRVMVAAETPIWLTGGPMEATADFLASLEEPLSTLTPTLAQANFPACVEAALAAEPYENCTSRFVCIFSDGTAQGWKAETETLWQAIGSQLENATIPVTVNVVRAESSGQVFRNLAIDRVATNRPGVGLGESFTVTAHVRNHGDQLTEETTITWDVGGEQVGTTDVPRLEPGQSIELTFDLEFDHPGVYAVGCRASITDQLPEDNRAVTVVEAVEELKVALCRQADSSPETQREPDFFRAATGAFLLDDPDGTGRTVFRTEVIDVDQLGEIDLNPYRCIVLDDVAALSAEANSALVDFVSQGGGLWIVLGPHTDPNDFNTVVFAGGTGLAPLGLAQQEAAETEHPFLIHPPDGGHPATVLLGDTQRLDIDDVTMMTRWKFETPEAGQNISVLLETGSGDPLVMENAIGRGRVLVQGIPFQSRWSNLPLTQVCVPLVQEWLWYLAEGTAQHFNLDPGVPVSISTRYLGDAETATLRPPWGSTVELSAVADDAGSLFRFRQTILPGEYVIRAHNGDGEIWETAFHVHRNATESTLTSLTPDEQKKLETDARMAFVDDVLRPPTADFVPAAYEPAWGYLLIAALLFLVGESLLALRATRQRYAVLTPPEPGT